jgi:hypothetical protein
VSKEKVFLITQSVLCALVAGLLAAGALCLYIDGAAKQAEGDLFYYMYTREKAGAKLLPILPLFFTALGLTLAGLILGIKDEKAEKPVRDEILLKDLGSIQNKAVHQTATQGELYARVAIITLAVCMIIAGIINGGLEDVLAKGATICTECVGLG